MFTSAYLCVVCGVSYHSDLAPTQNPCRKKKKKSTGPNAYYYWELYSILSGNSIRIIPVLLIEEFKPKAINPCSRQENTDKV